MVKEGRMRVTKEGGRRVGGGDDEGAGGRRRGGGEKGVGRIFPHFVASGSDGVLDYVEFFAMMLHCKASMVKSFT